MSRDAMTMLQALLKDERLTEDEREAFSGMERKLKHGFINRLTHRQFSHVEDVFMRLELDADEPSQNLVSSGKIPSTPSRERFAFELMPRPLKPPGRA